MNCTHKRASPGRMVEVEHPITGEIDLQWEAGQEISTTVDLDCGRYQCTTCGKVMYYTGLWRDFWEKGIPCAGSELVSKYAKPALNVPHFSTSGADGAGVA